MSYKTGVSMAAVTASANHRGEWSQNTADANGNDDSSIPFCGMETYFGYIETVQDALLIFESCRIGALPRVHRRLNERERRWLRSGSVYVWDEEESDVRRWTDGRLWSPSRIRGRFLVYRELSCRRTEAMDVDSPDDPMSDAVMSPSGNHSYGGRGHGSNNGSSSVAPVSSTTASLVAAIPNPTRYGSKRLLFKQNGLIKRTIAVETSSGRRLHLISYFSEADLATGVLPRPRFDPRLQHVQIPREIYPELHPMAHDMGTDEPSPLQAMRSASELTPSASLSQQSQSPSPFGTKEFTFLRSHSASHDTKPPLAHSFLHTTEHQHQHHQHHQMQHDMSHRSSRSSVYRESSPRVPSPKQAPPRSPAPKEWHLPLPPPSQTPSRHHFSMAVNSPHENPMMRVSTPPLTPPEHSPATPAISLHQPQLASVPSHAYTGCITTAPLSPTAATVSLHPASLGVALLPPTPVALITPSCYDLQSVSIGYANSSCNGQPRILLPMMTTTTPTTPTAHGYAHSNAPDAILMRDYREHTPSSGASSIHYNPSITHFNTSWQPRSDEDRRQVNALGAHLRL